uniref:Capsid protein n=1 Tax=Torque teno virus 17 TaxID=687356 RepID=A0A9E8ADX5_9VIRU|nr:ORF1 [Torque teno virus 17]
MAWWGWRRRWRRRPWWRRRRRARRTVRRKTWGRRRRRRRTYRRRRTVRLRRRRRKKLVLTQWNPPYVRRCYIKGVMPVVICGQHRSSFNYAIHSDDYQLQVLPFGGGMSTITMSLKVLYDEFTRHLNRWSYPNDQLDLCRYRGCTLRVYRDTSVDYIMTFDTIPPMKMNELTAPNTHPGMLMLQKQKILIPSWKTRPKGKKYKRVKIHPPKMFEDKWYSQSDLCPVPLVSLRFTAASFQYPFCSPQTNTPITTFQVLQFNYNTVIGYPNQTNTSEQTTFEKWLYGSPTHYQAFATEAHLRPRAYTPTGKKITNDLQNPTCSWDGTKTTYKVEATTYKNWENWWRCDFYASKADSLYGYCSFTPKDDTGIQNITTIRNNNFKYLTTWDDSHPSHINSTYTNASFSEYEYHCGWFSSMFISPHRYQLQFRTAYFDCTYNPLNDHGKGNMMWFQYLTKPTTEFDAVKCRYVLKDIPLWAMAHGYSDYIDSQLGPTQDHETVGLVCVICPYTRPRLYNNEKPTWGYVFYDSLFGQGKMPDGTSQISRFWAQRWRVYLGFQEQVLNDLSNSGPWAYRDEYHSTTLTMGYTFKFNWGGDMMFPQVIKNPCSNTGLAPGTDRQRRDVQVIDPLTVGPQWVFHPFDIRRGLYNPKAIKRVSEKPIDDEPYIKLPKRPRFITASEFQGQEGSSYSGEGKSELSEEESETEVQETTVQRQLRVQLREQQLIGKQLRELWVQLAKTQSNTHLNPLLFSRA